MPEEAVAAAEAAMADGAAATRLRQHERAKRLDLAREVRAELDATAAAGGDGAGGATRAPDYASHRGLALASVLSRLHAAGARL